MITNSDQIKEATSMRDVLQHYGVTIDNRGKGQCPVHGGKDKNFSVKNDIAACWSQCGGKVWDKVGIIQELDRCDYYQAIHTLAGISGLQVVYDADADPEEIKRKSAEEHAERESIRITNETYLKWLSPVLSDGKRDISEIFEAGIQPAKLSDTYIKIGLNKESCIKAGVLKEGEHGLYDTFRERIIFPIRDDKGILVGFAGRYTGTDTKIPKYLNTAENALYHKRDTLYGIWQAKKAIHTAGYAILVEGQMDMISLYKHEIGHVVAGGGTALTIQQAQRLSYYTDTVVLLYDGDEAGRKAAASAVPILSAAGLDVKISDMEAGLDPDALVRSEGAEAVHDLIKKATDGVMQVIMSGYDREDAFSAEEAIKTAAAILSRIKKDSVVTHYLDLLGQKGMLGRSHVKTIKERIKDGDGSKIMRFTNDQKSDIVQYGIYEKGCKYYLCFNTKHEGIELSNFIIKPIMLVVGNERSQRVVEVKNEHGHGFVRAISSDDFVELTAFKKQMERMGNYLYKGKPENFLPIKEKIYMQTPTAYPITVLGLHREGFYAWANGITTAGGSFKKVDEYGIVEHEGVKYYLPAMSKIHDYIKSDDQDNSYEVDREFVMIEGKCPNVSEWGAMMVGVYGEFGKMAIAWYIAAIYRDVIYRRFNFFPHLNLFGPPGSGKSYLGWSLSYMFGHAKKPFHLMQGTNVGFYRRLAQVRNGISWFDEYSNELDVKRVEALKSAYDGVGHEKGVMSSDNRTNVTNVNSALLISGQHQTTKDVALFTRCITLSFKTGKFSKEAVEKAAALRKLEEKGVLSQITGELHKYRHAVDARWNTTNDEVMEDLKQIVGSNLDARMLANYSIPLTAAKILGSMIDLGFKYSDLLQMSADTLEVQVKAVANDDELSIWWRILSFAVSDHELRHGYDLIVEDAGSLTLEINSTDKKQKRTLAWDEPKQLLYLRFDRSFPKYQEMHRRQYNKVGLNLGSLQHYLRHSEAYIGEYPSKRFDGKCKRSWVFDCEKLPIELDKSEDANRLQFPGAMIPNTTESNKSENSYQDDLPF